MNYPLELLPKNNYKIIITEDLPPEAVIIRTTDEKVVLDELGKIPEKYIVKSGSEKQVFDLSVNLYGVYKLEHIKIQIKKDSGIDNKWAEGDECLDNIDKSSFELNESKSAIFFSVFDIHNEKIPYIKEINGQTSDFEATCKVKHEPTVSNFWHFEISYSDIQYVGSGWQKKTKRLNYTFFIKNSCKNIN